MKNVIEPLNRASIIIQVPSNELLSITMSGRPENYDRIQISKCKCDKDNGVMNNQYSLSSVQFNSNFDIAFKIQRLKNTQNQF